MKQILNEWRQHIIEQSSEFIEVYQQLRSTDKYNYGELTKKLNETANARFEKLGEGNTRAAYDMGDKKILKVMTPDSSYQKANSSEADNFQDASEEEKEILAKILDRSGDQYDIWIIQEKVFPITSQTQESVSFLKQAGGYKYASDILRKLVQESPRTQQDLIKYYEEKESRFKQKYYDHLEKVVKNIEIPDYIFTIASFVRETNLIYPTSEYLRSANIGVDNDKLKLFDYP